MPYVVSNSIEVKTYKFVRCTSKLHKTFSKIQDHNGFGETSMGVGGRDTLLGST